MSADARLVVAAAKLGSFGAVYKGVELILLIASLATAWAFFDWKLALVVFLAEGYAVLRALRGEVVKWYAEKLEMELELEV